MPKDLSKKVLASLIAAALAAPAWADTVELAPVNVSAPLNNAYDA